MKTFFNFWAGLLLFTFMLTGCDNQINDPGEQGTVLLSSPTVEPDGSLSLNATARFDARYTGETDSSSLIYEWSLQETRATLIVDGRDMGAQTQTSTPYIFVRGNKAGEETIRVKALNNKSEKSQAEDALSFEITTSSGTSNCFDGPTLFYRGNNWEDPSVIAIGLESDTKKISELPPNNWLMDISPDGNWFIRQDFTDRANNVLWLDACDGSESRKLVEGLHIEEPVFGPNGQYIYYSKLIDYPQQPEDPRAHELVRLDIETGEKVFISEFGVFSLSPRVSPDGKWIAFEHKKPTFDDNGGYTGSIVHLAVMPSEGGPARFLTQITGGEMGRPDWSPDSKNLIFYFKSYTVNDGPFREGIYRIDVNGGGDPFFLFGEGASYQHNIAYYANGGRIAFEGHPNANDTQFDIWSIDANGNDLQRLTDERYNVFLQFIWEPR